MPKLGPLKRAWSDGQCLQACIASILGADVARIPDPTASYNAKADWHEHYNTRLAKATGFRLSFLPPSLCPPRNNALWIAGIREEEGDAHAVIARGHHVVHDSAGIYTGCHVPMDRLADGMLVVPTRRVVPVLSPLGRGSAVVAA
jgi:hypothetical protein